MAPRLSCHVDRLKLRSAFRISRGAKSEAEVVTCELSHNGLRGRGECVPYTRYGETVDSVIEAIESCARPLEQGMDRDGLQRYLPAGAARNAVDCALWDLEAKRHGVPAWQRAGLATAPQPVTTAYTISLDEAGEMAEAARGAGLYPLLKLKLGGGDGGDLARIEAVRQAAPKTRLIVDANEGWTLSDLRQWGDDLARLGVELIEQPVPAGQDDTLKGLECQVPLAADESGHSREELDHLIGRYAVVNIKLDKTGGLTEALALARACQQRGLRIMVGCMVGSSLAMAPAMLLTPLADWVDLDGPLLLAEDREPGLIFDGATIHPPEPALWG